MNNKPFRFKQFDIFQNKTAMKVGTDGVLLGAWSNLYSGNKILDIGTGTGLVAMMLAQRFRNSKIEAVEIDTNSFHQAKSNFENSIFKGQLSITNCAIQNYYTKNKYDLIVSNPPFFKVNKLVELNSRKQAREQASLTFEELLNKTSLFLNENGCASFIIPFDQQDYFCRIALENDLKLNKLLYVKGNNDSPIKRVLLEFSFLDKKLEEKLLVIETERHQYTAQYTHLTKDFYLKM